jgi:hypothetical protein
MSLTPTRLPRTPRLRRLVVLLCALLSVLASSDSLVLEQILEGPTPQATGPVLSQDDPDEDDDDMLRPTPAGVGRRAPRKDVRSPFFHEDPDVGRRTGGCPAHGSAPLPFPARAGSEHARRNGFGAPLLC